MNTINGINAFANMDIHGNLYQRSQEGDTIVNGEELSMDLDYGALHVPVGCLVNLYRQTLHKNKDEVQQHFTIKLFNKNNEAYLVQVTYDRTTGRCDIDAFSPALAKDKENQEKNLSEPIDINGIPVRMNPKEAKIYLNMVPTIKNGKIIECKSYPTISIESGSYSWGKQEDGSIEKILYDITNNKGLPKIVLEGNRVIHGYYTPNRGNVIDIYKIQKDLSNPGKFTKVLLSSQEIPDNYQNMAVINDKMFLYNENPTPNVKVYQILQNRIQLMCHVENIDAYSMQDFLNRVDLKTFFKAISRDDYAEIEKEYIKNMLTKQNINNTGLTINLETGKGGIKK